MSIPILEACRKRKRRPKIFGFQTFANPGYPITSTGPFRDNVRVFLRECAEIEDYNVEGMPTWCTLLVHENKSFIVPLYTIEVDVKHSSQPYCDQCRCTGWSNNFVSRRKYHLIIPSDSDWNKPLADGVLHIQTHLLHGLIHCNGFGHLICINGLEGGSRYLCGRQIMDLWDRICTNLRACKITVEDSSRKRSMDLRLLHGVAYGHPWFGRWGYKFCHGSFGVMEHSYHRSIEILSNLELEKLIEDFRDSDQKSEIKKMIGYYRDMSETQLITIKDLLRFLLTIKSRACAQSKPVAGTTASSSSSTKFSIRSTQQKKNQVKEKSCKYRKFSSIIANMDSRWPSRRLEFAAEVIVEALKEKKADTSAHNGMTRQDVRDAARLQIGDTGLLDHVLKSMNNVIVGNHVVRRAVNPATRLLEYTIHEYGDGFTAAEPEPEPHIDALLAPTLNPGSDVYSDVLYLYLNVLLNYPESELIQLAAQTILDSKHFLKEWPFNDDEDQILTFTCQVVPSFVDLEAKVNKESLPGELIMVPLYSTAAELKQAAENALRDTYCIMEKLVVTEIEGLEELEDREVLFGLVESGSRIWVRGSGIDFESNLRHEGGADNWMVRCECGARDDDGERMVACDICEIWQHTRCCGIEDSDTLPPLFVCRSCCFSLVPLKSEASFKAGSSDDMLYAPVFEYGAELHY